jgi:head-tail adaptor
VSSIEARFRDRLVVQRASATVDGLGDPVLDEYGQPVVEWSPIATIDGLVVPKTSREVVLQSQGGAVVNDHTVYVMPGDITAADRILRYGTTGPYFQVTGIRDALGDHLELDVLAVS